MLCNRLTATAPIHEKALMPICSSGGISIDDYLVFWWPCQIYTALNTSAGPWLFWLSVIFLVQLPHQGKMLNIIFGEVYELWKRSCLIALELHLANISGTDMGFFQLGVFKPTPEKLSHKMKWPHPMFNLQSLYLRFLPRETYFPDTPSLWRPDVRRLCRK